MTTLTALSDELGGFRIAAESLGMTFIGQISWRAASSLSLQESKNFFCDCLAISMPSGSRVFGFESSDGSWVGGNTIAKTVADVIARLNPNTIILYARRALLTDRFGATFCEILKALHNYSVAWKTVNLSWYDIPQDANRVMVVATRYEVNETPSRWFNIIRGDLPPSCLANFVLQPAEELSVLLEARVPRIGRAAPVPVNPFCSGGYYSSGAIYPARYPIIKKTSNAMLLSESLQFMWNAEPPPTLYSVRFTSRHGKKGLAFKRDGLAHSFGPSISAWPLLAVKPGALEALNNMGTVVDWRAISGGYEVFRLSPRAAIGLFGQEALPLGVPLHAVGRSIAQQYEAASSTVPPRIISTFLLSLKQHLS
jgi:hypothetical protein